MNRVHNQCSKNLTQEKYRVEPGQKQVKCTECTALASPRAQAGSPAPMPRMLRAPSRAFAAPPARLLPLAPRARAPAAPRARAPVLPSYRSPVCCVPAQRPPATRAPRACCLRARACTPSPAPARCVAATVAVLQYSTALSQSQYNPLYCDTILPTASLPATIH